MQRNPAPENSAFILVVGIAVIGGALGASGVLGPDIKADFDKVANWFRHGAAPGGAPVGTQPPASGKSSQLLAQIGNNPNFVSQATTWRSERRQNGEDPNSWTAFVAHEIAIGAPDPGSPPPEWPAAFGGTFGQ